MEYYLKATGRKGGAEVVQTLPASTPDQAPLTFTVAAQGQPSQAGTAAQQSTAKIDGPLLGYSLRTISESQQVKRKFTMTRTEAETRHYHPSGALSTGGIGPAFDPATQITRVALGEGPFKILVIDAYATFDLAAYHVRSATVVIEYGAARRSETITLTPAKPTGQTQFFADDAGTQAYSYWVELTFDPDHVVGASQGVLRSRRFDGETMRSLPISLGKHSPAVPVEVMAGRLNFAEGIVKQVQLRVAPRQGAEGRTLILGGADTKHRVHVVPADPADRRYYMRQELFFESGSTAVENPHETDTQIVVNEPTDRILRMIPNLVDRGRLIKEALVDIVYRHADGREKRGTVHLSPEKTRSELAVVLGPGDVREWEATSRFVLNQGDPVTGAPQRCATEEPFISLTAARLRYAEVELLEDASVFSPTGLLAILVILGRDPSDRNAPSITIQLKAARTSAAVIVPGVAAGEPVQVVVEARYRGQPPQRTTTTLAATETTFYVQL